ncbi:MAG: ribosome recycling factor [Chloroflexi bacterium]|nr:ribosome recycling factor [Chloroflexota bacterium]
MVLPEQVEEALANGEARMKRSGESLERELGGIRTGRASPSLVEHLSVDYYGTPTPLNQLATITVPEARLLVIQPWDRQTFRAIERAIQQSDLGLNPSNDGTVIRLVLAALTEERRRELVRLVKRKVEEGRVAVRNVRRDVLEKLRDLEKKKEISEDDLRRAQEQLQKVTDAHIAEMEREGSRKEAEVMEV